VSFITVGKENSESIDLYYEDHGEGPTVVLIHGYPLSGRSWERQERALLAAGYRVVAYDRRGFGKSSQPSVGYDYDTFTADLDVVMTELALTDIALVGHSMGTGEVVHYLANYGSERVRKGVLVSPLGPFMLNTSDNPEGLPKALFDGFAEACRGDRLAWVKGFLENFYNRDVLGGTLVGDEAFWDSWNIGAGGSAKGTLDCIAAWATDFRADLPKIDVPVLVVQGDQDRILPPDVTGNRLPGLIKDLKHVIVEGGPHGITWTHADMVNSELLEFIG
jgi:non-heme chloroperoxidase